MRFSTVKPGRGSYFLDEGHPLSAGLVSLLLFNEGAGALVHDEVTPRATLSNAGIWTGEGLAFGAVSDGLKMGGEGLPLGAAPRTIWARFRTTKALPYASYASLVAWGLGAAGAATIIALGSDGHFGDSAFGASQYGDAFGAGQKANEGRWHDGVISFDGALWRCFLDGVFRDARPMATNTLDSGDLFLGGDGISSSDGLGGEIAGAAIWNRALSEAEIAQLHSAPYSMLLQKPPRLISPGWSD